MYPTQNFWDKGLFVVFVVGALFYFKYWQERVYFEPRALATVAKIPSPAIVAPTLVLTYLIPLLGLLACDIALLPWKSFS